MRWKLDLRPVNLLLTAGMAAAVAAPGAVRLNVVATDRAGRPVTDLRPIEMLVADDGAPQKIASLRLNPSNPAPARVILLDLSDLDYQQSALAAQRLRQSLTSEAVSTSLYLYTVVGNGDLYPLHAPPAANTQAQNTDDAWVKRCGSLLDGALRKVVQPRAMDLIAHPDQRFMTAYSALDSIRQAMARLGGRKQLFWITDGISAAIRNSPRGFADLAPRLRQLAAQFNDDGIVIYTLDPTPAFPAGDRQGLEILSAATGGRSFISADLNMALRQARTDASATYLIEYNPPQSGNSEGKYHKVRITCTRPGVRLRSQESYLAGANVHPPEVTAADRDASPAAVSSAVLIEPAWTFVGSVRLAQGASIVLELEDRRFIVVDLRANSPIALQAGDRVSVRSGKYDGHGLLADSISLLETGDAGLAAPAKPVDLSADADPILQRARDTEASMDRALPDFLCTEVVKRYADAGRRTQWKLRDTLSAEVFYSRERGESYRDIRVDGRPTQKTWPELGGDVSTGEFGSLLHSLLANRDTEFQFIGDDRLNGVAAREFGFRVGRAQSDWKVLSDYQFIFPPYRGRIWLERERNRVLRIERTAEEIPPAFPLSSVEGEVDFSEVRLGSAAAAYLLPSHAETRVCVRDGRGCSRKTIEFRGYRKFTGESKITF